MADEIDSHSLGRGPQDASFYRWLDQIWKPGVQVGWKEVSIQSSLSANGAVFASAPQAPVVLFVL